MHARTTTIQGYRAGESGCYTLLVSIQHLTRYFALCLRLTTHLMIDKQTPSILSCMHHIYYYRILIHLYLVYKNEMGALGVDEEKSNDLATTEPLTDLAFELGTPNENALLLLTWGATFSDSSSSSPPK